MQKTMLFAGLLSCIVSFPRSTNIADGQDRPGGFEPTDSRADAFRR
jgi:hypothetical protein